VSDGPGPDPGDFFLRNIVATVQAKIQCIIAA
jgi:hypothetical protein